MQRPILIVDDDPAIRSLLCDCLTLSGYPVASAASGRDALEAVQAARPALILLDIMMPDMDGFQFLDALKAEGVHVPVFAMTASCCATTMQHLARLHAEGTIRAICPKPFNIIALLHAAGEIVTQQLPTI